MGPWIEDLRRLPEVVWQSPERLWIAVPALLALLAVFAGRRARSGGALLPLLLRAAAVAALLALLLDPAVGETATRRGRVIALADVSPSVGEEGVARERELLRDGAVEVIAFGAAPRVSRGGEIAPDPRASTDLAAALLLGLARSGGEPARIHLLGDGRATEPGVARATALLRARGVELSATALPEPAATAPAQFQATDLEPPPELAAGEAITVIGRARSTGAARARARLFLDGAPAAEVEARLRAGDNDISFPGVRLSPGRVTAQLLLEGDASPSDNLATREWRIARTPRVLLLAGRERKALLGEALRTQGMEVGVAAAGAEPDLKEWDAILLLPDAPAADLEGRSGAISEFVGRGGGLLAVGGSEGPGLARLAGTPLAFLLPLDVPARPPRPEEPPPPQPGKEPRIEIVEERKQAYPVSLCLLLDRSGSMAESGKLRRAQEAAAAAARALTADDRICVIAFHDTAEVIVPPQPAGDPWAVLRALSTLTPEGQTAMFAALQLASEVMRREPSPIRHIVLLSDGIATDEGRWRDLITGMAEEKITLSSVGIGFRIDDRLPQFARWGQGKYWSAEASEIPQVVTQDTLRIVEARDRRGKDAERPVEPPPPRPEPPSPPAPAPPETPAKPPPGAPLVAEAGAPRDALKGIADADLPEVTGVEEGTLRLGAWTAARAGPEGPPVIAYRRIGLGTSAALTVDPEATLSMGLASHPEFPRLVAQLLRSVLPDVAAEPLALAWAREGGRIRFRVEGEDGRPRTDVALSVTAEGRPLRVVRRGDFYEAQAPEGETPSLLRVRFDTFDRAFLVAGADPRERIGLGADREALLGLAGAAERLDIAIPSAPEIRETRKRPLPLPFLLLAAILLPFDAWARRRASASR